MKLSFEEIIPYRNGKAGLITGLCEQIGLDKIFDAFLTAHTGRPPEISYGHLAEMMLVTMADEHHPLYRMHDYLENVDLDSLLGTPIDRNKLNDDRFGGFLDLLQEAGGADILSAIAVQAFKHYGIRLSSVNFDTTSKVMWGQYESEEGTIGAVDITFGYSKQHRPDKKQIMFGMGVTQGICVDGQVFSGNLSDKTYNVDNLDRASSMKELFESDGEPFFYIADSAAFTREFLEKAKRLKIEIITRMPDNVIECRKAIEKALDQLETLPIYHHETQTRPSVYRVLSDACIYHDVPMNMAVCYSEKLEETKKSTVGKRVLKERDAIDKVIKRLSKRTFACLEDAQIEIETQSKADLAKLKYHSTTLQIVEEAIKRPGRPSKTPENDLSKTIFSLDISVNQDAERIQRCIQRECIFVVVSTDQTITGEAILREYKTQGGVERKFQFLKSPQFVNALYVDSPRRVEALGYLMLILMLVLSIAEHVVRREMKKESATILGPGDKKLTRPSLIAIFRIFFSVKTAAIRMDGKLHRGFNEPLRPNVKAVMRYLGIPEDIFIRG